MPVLAIGAAIIADVGAAGALAGGIGALTLTGALEVVGAVGATLGAVGAVTHDKGLSMAGMVLGGIGGIGALASSAGLFGAEAGSAPLFGSADSALSDVAVTGENAAASGMLDSLGYNAGAGTDIVNSLTGASPAGLSADAGAAAATPPPSQNSLINSSDLDSSNFGNPAQDAAAQSIPPSGAAATPGLNSADSTATAMPPPASAIPGASQPGTIQAPVAPSVSAPAAPFDPALAPVNVTGRVAGTGEAASPGVLGSIASFAKTNPLLSYGLVQAAGSFISGATSTLTPAQVSALNAQAAQNQANANLSANQLKNMQQPVPVASRTPQPTGIINAAPNVGIAA